MKHIVVLTGAGMSAESGLKTFRDANGLWEGHRVMEVASPEGFKANPELVFNFYNQRRKQLLTVKPNTAHFDLAALESSEGYYDDALIHSKKYETFKNRPEDMASENLWMIKTCEFAIEAKKHPVPFKPENLGAGVNTSDPEYFPTLTVDQKELLFTRRVTGTSSWQEDFFVSPDQEGYWATGQAMPKNINTANNEGAPTYAPDGRTLIFVGCINERHANTLFSRDNRATSIELKKRE